MRVLVEIVQERASGDDPLVLLETAIAVAGEASGAADDLIEHYVGAARAANVSWTLIGERLGVSKQAARQKFAHRLQVSDVSRVPSICCSGCCTPAPPPASLTGSA